MRKGLVGAAVTLALILLPLSASADFHGRAGGDMDHGGDMDRGEHFGGWYGPSFGTYWGPDWDWGWDGGWGLGWGWNSDPGAYAYSHTGEVKLDTSVKDAQVYINGGYVGTTHDNKTLRLRPGEYKIEIREGGRTLFAQNVYVQAGKTLHLHPVL